MKIKSQVLNSFVVVEISLKFRDAGDHPYKVFFQVVDGNKDRVIFTTPWKSL